MTAKANQEVSQSSPKALAKIHEFCEELERHLVEKLSVSQPQKPPAFHECIPELIGQDTGLERLQIGNDIATGGNVHRVGDVAKQILRLVAGESQPIQEFDKDRLCGVPSKRATIERFQESAACIAETVWNSVELMDEAVEKESEGFQESTTCTKNVQLGDSSDYGVEMEKEKEDLNLAKLIVWSGQFT